MHSEAHVHRPSASIQIRDGKHVDVRHGNVQLARDERAEALVEAVVTETVAVDELFRGDV